MKTLIAITPAAILALCVGLLQWHSLRFWGEAIGPTGYPWSVALEMVSLWGWVMVAGRRAAVRWITVATLATALLLAGPLYRLADPIVQAWSSSASAEHAAAVELRSIEQAIAETQAGLTSYRDIAKTRIGWQGKIDEMESTLKALRGRKVQISAGDRPSIGNGEPGSSIRMNWQAQAVLAMQAASVLVFQVAIVMLIPVVFAGSAKFAQREKPGENLQQNRQPQVVSNGKTPVSAEDLLVGEFGRARGFKTKGEVAAALGLTGNVLSLYIHWRKNAAAGSRSLGSDKIAEIDNALRAGIAEVGK